MYMYIYIYIYIYICIYSRAKSVAPIARVSSVLRYLHIRPAVVRCDMVLHQAFRARHIRNNQHRR